jgi:hypothetical protein
MRAIALLATYNEERFISGCLEHLFSQRVDAYLLDNASTDQTVAIAERYLDRGLIGIETVPREGVYPWRVILNRKDTLSTALDADWFMHVDADEIHLPLHAGRTLVEEFAEADAQGYNVVNFTEYVFVPTREAPDHDHPRFQETMRWYYPFVPTPAPRLMRAWKRQPDGVGLALAGGHQLQFPGLRLCPISLPMRHYMFLSVPHAIQKYVPRQYDPEELARGWHGWRSQVTEDIIQLPSQSELSTYLTGNQLDASRPRTTHLLHDWVTVAKAIRSTNQSTGTR